MNAHIITRAALSVTSSFFALASHAAPAVPNSGVAIAWADRIAVWGGSDNVEAPDNRGAIYDRTTATWTEISQINAPQPRASHTGSAMENRLFIWGGYSFQPSSSTPRQPRNDGAIFDVTTNEWMQIERNGAPRARYHHGAATIGTKLYIWGGADSIGASRRFFADGGVYDLATRTWTALPTARAPRGRGLPGMVAVGGKIFVWGGYDASAAGLVGDGAIFDPETNQWTALPTQDAPSARFGAMMTTAGDKVVIWSDRKDNALPSLGRRDGAIFDLTTFAWMPMSQTGAPSPRTRAMSAGVDGRLIVWGGTTDATITGTLDDGYAFDPSTNTWTTLGSIGRPGARLGAHAAALADGFFVYGGTFVSSLDGRGVPIFETRQDGGIYSFDTASWESVAAP